MSRPQLEMSEEVQDKRTCTICNQFVSNTGSMQFTCGHRTHNHCYTGDLMNDGCNADGTYSCKRCGARQLQCFAPSVQCDSCGKHKKKHGVECDSCGKHKKKHANEAYEDEDEGEDGYVSDEDAPFEYTDSAIHQLDENVADAICSDRDNRISVFFSAGKDLAYLRDNHIAGSLDDLVRLGFCAAHLTDKEHASPTQLSMFDGVTPVSLYEQLGVTAGALAKLRYGVDDFKRLNYNVVPVPRDKCAAPAPKGDAEDEEQGSAPAPTPVQHSAPIEIDSATAAAYREKMRARLMSAQYAPKHQECEAQEQVDEYDDEEEVVSNAYQQQRHCVADCDVEALETVYVQGDYEEEEEVVDVDYEYEQAEDQHECEHARQPGRLVSAVKPSASVVSNDFDVYVKKMVQSGDLVPREVADRLRTGQARASASATMAANAKAHAPWMTLQ